MGSLRGGRDWATSLSLFIFMPWRRKWQPTPVFLPRESRTRLSDFTLTFHFHALEKEMATHSSVLASRIPGMAESGGLQSIGFHRVGHDWSNSNSSSSSSLKITIMCWGQEVFVKREVIALKTFCFSPLCCLFGSHQPCMAITHLKCGGVTEDWDFRFCLEFKA